LQAERELHLTIGPALNEGAAARLDLLEVFAQTKEEFGWKERVEAAEAMEVDLVPAVGGSRRPLLLPRPGDFVDSAPPTPRVAAAERALTGTLQVCICPCVHVTMCACDHVCM
jgi:hypothetical protein